MSQYETELRRKLASNQADIYETITWFVAAIDIQAYADGKPGEPDLSEFEQDFLAENVERYQRERLRRMPLVEALTELLNNMATAAPAPNYPKVDMSGMPDRALINAAFDGPYVDCATQELVKRANAKRVTFAEYIKAVFERQWSRRA